MVGDGSSFQKMMTQSVQSAQEAANKVSLAADQIQKVGDNLKSFANAAVSALAGYGLATSLTGAFEKFSDLERNQIRLKASIESSGQSVNTVLPHYKALADEITNGSLATKGQVFNLIQQAQNMGKSGAELDRLVKNSVAFGAITGQSAESMFRLAVAFERGDERMVKFALGLRHAAPGMDVMKIAQERLAAGYKVMQAEQETVSGQLEKLQKAFVGVTMEVGKMVADAIAPFVQIMTQASDQFKGLDQQTKTQIATIAALTLALLGLPALISTIVFLFNAMGGSFVVNTSLQVGGLVLSGAAWLAWQVIVLSSEAAVAFFSLTIGLLSGLFGLFGGNVALSLLSLVTWSTVMTVVNAVVWLTNVAIGIATFLWAAYTGTVVAATVSNSAVALGMAIAQGAIWLVNTAIAIASGLWATYTGTAVAATAASASFTGGALLAKVAVWLLNAALTVKNVLLAGIPLVIGLVVAALIAFTGGVFLAVAATAAFIGTLVILTGAFATLFVVGVAVALIAVAFWDVAAALVASSNSSGFVVTLVTTCRELYLVVKDIVWALQNDMPTAWRLVKALAMLAVYELRDMWPPLWEFVKAGFSILAKFSADTFITSFQRAFVELARLMSELPGFKRLFGEFDLDKLNNELKRSQELTNQLAIAQAKAATAALNFGDRSAEAQAAAAEVGLIRAEIANKRSIKEAAKSGEKVGEVFNSSVAKELHKLDGVLSGSAEALHRINDYRDKLLASTAKPSTAAGVPANGGVPPIVVNPAAGARLENNADDPAAKRQDEANKLLQQIRDALQNNQNAGPVMFPLGVA